jgi:protocatechuate 3,4-dioxygenase beta subunit
MSAGDHRRTNHSRLDGAAMPSRTSTAAGPVLTYEGRPLPDPSEPVYDQGLAFDVETLIGRRRILKGLGLGAVSVGLAACAPAGAGLVTPGSTFGAPDACATAIPEETAGPYPGNGTNGPDVLAESGVVRRDIRSSYGASTTSAEGVPLTIRFAVLDLARACEPYAGAAVYAWHCDRAGRYSLYSAGVEGENYLRGVQAAGDDGIVEFLSVFPGCYPGRWPHVHFEVYPTLDAASDVTGKVATSQIAFPGAACEEVYATGGYESSAAALSRISLATDGVFGEDLAARQMGTMSGSVADGLVVELAVPVGG